MRIKVFNTGFGLKEGDPDPHWQIVARSDDPRFKPRPAVVTHINYSWPESRPNAPAESQWLSVDRELTPVPNWVTYTFRTTFEVPGLLPGSAVLRGRFIADNHVKAVRLNGVAMSVDEHGYSELVWFAGFSGKKGFVEGTNTLEIDVDNGDPNGGDAGASVSAMMLRVELDGDYLCIGGPGVGKTSGGPAPTTTATQKGE